MWTPGFCSFLNHKFNAHWVVLIMVGLRDWSESCYPCAYVNSHFLPWAESSAAHYWLLSWLGGAELQELCPWGARSWVAVGGCKRTIVNHHTLALCPVQFGAFPLSGGCAAHAGCSNMEVLNAWCREGQGQAHPGIAGQNWARVWINHEGVQQNLLYFPWETCQNPSAAQNSLAFPRVNFVPLPDAALSHLKSGDR